MFKFGIREIVHVGMFVSFAVVSAMVSRFAPGIVPFSFMPMVAILAGALLGKRLGATAMLIYSFLGVIGIPVFASPPYAGFSYILKPTFGFVIGYVLAAYSTGWLVERIRSQARFIFAALTGLIPLYLCGLIYLWISLNFWVGSPVDLRGVLKMGFLPFILKDALVSIGAGVLAYGVSRRLPRGVLIGSR